MGGVKKYTVFCDQNVFVTKELSDWLAPTNQSDILSQTHFCHRKLCLFERDTGAACTTSPSIGICAKFLFRSTNLVSFFHVSPEIKGAAYVRANTVIMKSSCSAIK